MDWEKFKGFCRRQTQKVNENYRHAEKTQDAEAQAGFQRIVTYRRVAASVSSRVDQLQQNIANSVALLEGIKDDLRAMDVDEISTAASRIEMVTLAMRKQHETMVASLSEASAKLRKYCEECSGIDNVFEDRRSKLLEYDFFRNKVADLKRRPPSDPARIPRNECREQEWQRAYDEANDTLKNLAHKLTLQGIRTVSETTATATTGMSKFYGENSQSWRATFGNAGVAAAIYTGAQAMAQSATAQLPKVQQAAASAATNAATNAAVRQGVPPVVAQAGAAHATTAATAAVGAAGAAGVQAAQPYLSQTNLASQPQLGGRPSASGTFQPSSQPTSESPSSPAPGAPGWGQRVKPAGDDPFAM